MGKNTFGEKKTRFTEHDSHVVDDLDHLIKTNLFTDYKNALALFGVESV